MSMTQGRAEQFAARFIEFLETGVVHPGLFTPDVFCDFTSPRWRLQAQGVSEVVQLRQSGHPGPGKVPRQRCDALQDGFVLEVEEEWEQAGESWYCRELFRADVQGDSIAVLAVYCTGDWDRARRAEHARSVRLLRP